MVKVYLFSSKVTDPVLTAVYMSHDLSMLRLIETFSESAPQVVLMLAIILQRDELGAVTGAFFMTTIGPLKGAVQSKSRTRTCELLPK